MRLLAGAGVLRCEWSALRGALRAAAPPPTPTLRRVRACDAAALLDGGAGAPRRFDEKYGDAPCVLDAIGEVILWGRVEHGVWVPLDISVVKSNRRDTLDAIGEVRWRRRGARAWSLETLAADYGATPVVIRSRVREGKED